MEARQIPDKYQYQQQCLHSGGLVYATYIETVGTKVLDIKEGDIITTVCTCQQLVEAIAAHSRRLPACSAMQRKFFFLYLPTKRWHGTEVYMCMALSTGFLYQCRIGQEADCAYIGFGTHADLALRQTPSIQSTCGTRQPCICHGDASHLTLGVFKRGCHLMQEVCVGCRKMEQVVGCDN